MIIIWLLYSSNSTCSVSSVNFKVACLNVLRQSDHHLFLWPEALFKLVLKSRGNLRVLFDTINDIFTPAPPAVPISSLQPSSSYYFRKIFTCFLTWSAPIRWCSLGILHASLLKSAFQTVAIISALLPPGKSLSILRTLSSNHFKKEGKKRSTPGFLAVTNQSHNYILLVRFCSRLWRSSLQLLLHCWPSHCAQWTEILGVLIYIGIVCFEVILFIFVKATTEESANRNSWLVKCDLQDWHASEQIHLKIKFKVNSVS